MEVFIIFSQGSKQDNRLIDNRLRLWNYLRGSLQVRTVPLCPQLCEEMLSALKCDCKDIMIDGEAKN